MASRSPERGARLVAHAWVDPAFKARALADGAAAAEELGLEVGPLRLIVVENTPDVHNVIVCTLCSCYPRMLLGIPPEWYKSRAYRSRVVREPRTVLAEFGTQLPEGVRDPRPRFHRRHALHRAADAAGRHRRLERGTSRGARHPRQPGRRRAPARRRLTTPSPGRKLRFPTRRGGTAMADTIRRLQYFALQVADQPGEGARLLQALRNENVNLVAITGFPVGKKAQVDLVPEDAGGAEGCRQETQAQARRREDVLHHPGRRPRRCADGHLRPSRRGENQPRRLAGGHRRHGPLRRDLLGQAPRRKQDRKTASGDVTAHCPGGSTTGGLQSPLVRGGYTRGISPCSYVARNPRNVFPACSRGKNSSGQPRRRGAAPRVHRRGGSREAFCGNANRGRRNRLHSPGNCARLILKPSLVRRQISVQSIG